MAKGKSKNKSSTNEIPVDRNENEQHNIDEVGHLLTFLMMMSRVIQALRKELLKWSSLIQSMNPSLQRV